MLGRILKLTLFLNVLFVLMALLWQATSSDASPIFENDESLANGNDDASYLSANDNNQRGALIIKRSLHSLVDQPSLIDNSHIRSRTRHRHLRKKLSPTKLKYSSNVFQSTGTGNNHLRTPERLQTLLDSRLKRFRMLDPDEFQEMLNSWTYQIPDQPIKELESMDTIGGMQLENYWLRK